jgi:hypothetical protein
MTATVGAKTDTIRCRFGVDALDQLETRDEPFTLTRAFISRLSGDDDLAIPDIRESV